MPVFINAVKFGRNAPQLNFKIYGLVTAYLHQIKPPRSQNEANPIYVAR